MTLSKKLKSSFNEFQQELEIDKSSFSHQPTYFFISSFWMSIFGFEVYQLRFLSVISGLGAILFTYYLVKRLINKKTAELTCLLLSINIVFLYYSSEASMYPLLFFLSIVSTVLFLKLLNSNKKCYNLGYILINTFALYLNFSFMFVLLFHMTFVIFLDTKNIRKFLSLVLIISLLFLPNIGRIYLLSMRLDEYRDANEPSIRLNYCPITDRLYVFSSGLLLAKSRIFEMSFNEKLIAFFYEHDFIDLFFLGKSEFFLFITYLVLMTTGALSIRTNKYKKTNIFWFLILWLCIPILTKYFIYITMDVICGISYVLFSLTPFLILVAKGIDSINKKYLKLFIILLLVLLSAVSIHKYISVYLNTTLTGPYWQLGQFIPENATKKEIAEYISFNSEPNLFPYIKIQKDAFKYINKNYPDAIVLTDWITAFKLSSPIHGWVKEPPSVLSSSLNIAEIGSNEFDIILKITGDGFDDRKRDLVKKALNKFDVSLIKKWKYYNMSVEIYKNDEK